MEGEKNQQIETLLNDLISFRRRANRDCSVDRFLVDCKLWQVCEWATLLGAGEGVLEGKDTTSRRARTVLESRREVLKYLGDCTDLGEARFPTVDSLAAMEGRHDEELAGELESFFRKKAHLLEALRAVFTSLHVQCRRNGPQVTRESAKRSIRIVGSRELSDNPVQIETAALVQLRELLKEYLAVWNRDEGLVVTPDWLKGWLFMHIADSACVEKYFERQGRAEFSPEETITFLRHLSTLALYILHWIRNCGDPHRFPFSDVEEGSKEHMEALLYVISEYAHVDYVLTRKATLFNTLLEIWSHEAVLYTIRDTYRDHINHMIETCLLGLLLLEVRHIEGNSFFEITLTDETGEDEARIVRNWIVAALMHDVGYAVNIIENAPSQIEFIDAPPIKALREQIEDSQKAHFADAVVQIVEGLSEDLPWLKDYDCEGLDHGVVSAAFLLWLVRDRNVPEESWRKDIRPALEAAARHNLRRLSTSYEDNPLACVLILCDHLQEWDRPLVKGQKIRHSLAVSLMGKEWRTTESESLVKHLKIQNAQFIDGCLTQTLDKELSFTLNFEDADSSDYHPSLSWVLSVYDLQDLKDFPHPISIAMRHPVLNSPEMDRLQMFLRENPEFSDLSDLVATSREETGWFRYSSQDEQSASHEVFTLELHKNDFSTVVAQVPQGFIAQFIDWKKKDNPV